MNFIAVPCLTHFSLLYSLLPIPTHSIPFSQHFPAAIFRFHLPPATAGSSLSFRCLLCSNFNFANAVACGTLTHAHARMRSICVSRSSAAASSFACNTLWIIAVSTQVAATQPHTYRHSFTPIPRHTHTHTHELTHSHVHVLCHAEFPLPRALL